MKLGYFIGLVKAGRESFEFSKDHSINILNDDILILIIVLMY